MPNDDSFNFLRGHWPALLERADEVAERYRCIFTGRPLPERFWWIADLGYRIGNECGPIEDDDEVLYAMWGRNSRTVDIATPADFADDGTLCDRVGYPTLSGTLRAQAAMRRERADEARRARTAKLDRRAAKLDRKAAKFDQQADEAAQADPAGRMDMVGQVVGHVGDRTIVSLPDDLPVFTAHGVPRLDFCGGATLEVGDEGARMEAMVVGHVGDRVFLSVPGDLPVWVKSTVDGVRCFEAAVE